MFKRKSLPIAAISLMLVLQSFAITPVMAGGNEYDAVCDHLEERYQAKKVKIPFMWLARFAVGIIRPAGVKSFKVTIYRNLNFSKDSLNREMNAVMRESFSDDWIPILRVRSLDNQQVYMNMREDGRDLKILLVTIEKDEAVVIRAKFNSEKLAEFINDPKIFGISLDQRQDPKTDMTEPDAERSMEMDGGN